MIEEPWGLENRCSLESQQLEVGHRIYPNWFHLSTYSSTDWGVALSLAICQTALQWLSRSLYIPRQRTAQRHNLKNVLICLGFSEVIQEGPLLTWGAQVNLALLWSSCSMLRGLFLFCCLSFASHVEHKDEKRDGSRLWKESRKFLPSESVGKEDQCVQWSDWIFYRSPKVTKGPEFALGHSVPCGGPWPLGERWGVLTFPLFSDQLSLALWNKHQLVKDFS